MSVAQAKAVEPGQVSPVFKRVKFFFSGNLALTLLCTSMYFHFTNFSERLYLYFILLSREYELEKVMIAFRIWGIQRQVNKSRFSTTSKRANRALSIVLESGKHVQWPGELIDAMNLIVIYFSGYIFHRPDLPHKRLRSEFTCTLFLFKLGTNLSLTCYDIYVANRTKITKIVLHRLLLLLELSSLTWYFVPQSTTDVTMV